jgi:outer membrane protein OmpA-like peptidoglycan-associated protein
MKPGFIISIIALAGVWAVSCATTAPQETAELIQAQQAYSQARTDPTINKYAPVPLYEAAQALDKAQSADSEEASRHYAYMAENKVELAQSVAAQKAAVEQLEQLRAEQQAFLLEMRSRQAEQARQEAQQAQEQVRAYRGEQQQQELIQARREAEQARAELEELENMQARKTDRGILVTFEDMLFGFDQSNLSSGAQSSISQLADFLKKHPERRVVIEGHTDNQGAVEYNRQLSKERAEAVAQALQAQGVSADRITTRGLGPDYPIAPNTTASGRQQNRRVEFIISTPEQPEGGTSGEPSGT